MYPPVTPVAELGRDTKRVYVAAYGFEDRSLGWAQKAHGLAPDKNSSILFKYENPKGENRVEELRALLRKAGITRRSEIKYQINSLSSLEDSVEKAFSGINDKVEEVVLDISAMTKFLILLCLCQLSTFNKTLRIVYSEANEYFPNKEDYNNFKADMKFITSVPSQGIESILRAKCLSSIRMQGQPVTMIAFTSFNEQLVRHMLGTISPHRLIFINGRPPHSFNAWRERATQEIHKGLISEYERDNQKGRNGLLKRVSSTLLYHETIEEIDKIHDTFGLYERIICAATGSKMQTVGLFFAKSRFPDIHIEYPTPDSYFPSGTPKGIRQVHEVVIPNFSNLLNEIKTASFPVNETILK